MAPPLHTPSGMLGRRALRMRAPTPPECGSLFQRNFRPLCLTREAGMAPERRRGDAIRYRYELLGDRRRACLNEDWPFESGPVCRSHHYGLEKTYENQDTPRSPEDREPGSPCRPNQPKQRASHTPQGAWPAGPG